ncbi:hypothetical protein C4D60_Mb04t00280 [Musa balbisiana]|uniref:EF-hand domain-containing protein n=1 Tax=Musa balbisiana TaxID=52838 RepID=A0A4S8K8J9_MUSBA|nr:hypothetical protein C4D60_Mb04t00280 [Musa balbisiana]
MLGKHGGLGGLRTCNEGIGFAETFALSLPSSSSSSWIDLDGGPFYRLPLPLRPTASLQHSLIVLAVGAFALAVLKASQGGEGVRRECWTAGCYAPPPPPGGYVSPFMALLPPCFAPATDPSLVACFQAADRDGIGFIDDKELQQALSS